MIAIRHLLRERDLSRTTEARSREARRCIDCGQWFESGEAAYLHVMANAAAERRARVVV